MIAVGLTIIAFWLVDVSGFFDFEFSFRVITGALLGALVILLNFLFLSFSVNRAVDLFLSNRGDGEMSDEEAAEYASKNTAGVEHAMTKSFIVRCVSIGVALILAFLIDWFNPLATLIPVLCYQPILTWGNYIADIFKGQKKNAKAATENASDTAEVTTENASVDAANVADNTTDNASEAATENTSETAAEDVREDLAENITENSTAENTTTNDSTDAAENFTDAADDALTDEQEEVS